MKRIFLIVDPYHDYAVRFIDIVVERFNYEPLCILSRRPSGSDQRRYLELSAWPHVYASPGEEEACARRLSSQADVVGVIPFSEAVLDPAIGLLRGLGSTWNRPEVLVLLRDKHALKERLRKTHPELSVGISFRIPMNRGRPCLPDLPDLPDQFVIKPNRGYANRSVGFFDSRTPRSQIEAFIDSCGERDLVLEEYLGGSEFFINGQVDAQSHSTAIAAFGYERVEANGRQVDWLTHKVAHDSSEFSILADYAQSVVSAVGLRRSPFHLEAKILDGVPRLIELGARLVGNGNALICNRLHGGKLDVFAAAADYYLHESAAGRLCLDWAAYDAYDLLYVHGISLEAGLINRVDGVELIERHPMFLEWVRRPTVGQRLYPTVDLFTSPWCFILRSPQGLDALRAAANDLRRELHINPPGTSFGRRFAVGASDLQRRLAGRIERLAPTDFKMRAHPR